jgi:outer membrane protein TolC
MQWQARYVGTASILLWMAAGCTTVPINGNRSLAQSSRPAKTEQPAQPEVAEQSDTPRAPRPESHASLRAVSAPEIDRVADQESSSEQIATSEPESSTVIEQVDAHESDLAAVDSTSPSDGAETPAATLPPPPNGDEVAVELPASYTLDLANVLYLADAQNPNVSFARERINEAYARVDRAESLWLPSLRAGMNYTHHEGNVQDVVGNVFNVNKSSFYGGLGAAGGGSGSPAIPGLVAQFHLTDAVFQPKIAGHQASSRQFAATAVRNDVLRNTAIAYLELVRAEQALAISEEAEDNTQKLVDLTGNYARTGLGLRSDYERMLAESAIRRADVVSRIEGVRVASARLAQLLHADPSVRIASGEPMVVPLDLHVEHASAAEYVVTGLLRRPELAEQKHLVCEAVERLRREKYAPLIPSVWLGMSYGAMGGGVGSSIINTNDRWDADAVAFWEIRNFGIGERAARDETSSLVRQAQKRELAILDQVAREVVEAHAQVTERERRIELSRQGIAAAERSYALNENRIENAQGLPIEVLQAVNALAVARLYYLNSVIDFNIAQFELCRAIGWFQNT